LLAPSRLRLTVLGHARSQYSDRLLHPALFHRREAYLRPPTTPDHRMNLRVAADYRGHLRAIPDRARRDHREILDLDRLASCHYPFRALAIIKARTRHCTPNITQMEQHELTVSARYTNKTSPGRASNNRTV